MGSSLAKPAAESSLTKLTSLSKSIEENTRILTERLHSTGLDAPSFRPSGLADFLFTEADCESIRARDKIIALTKELHDLTLGPREGLKTLAWDSVSYIALQAICEFRIAEVIPRAGAVSYEALASGVNRITGVSLLYSDLRRILRLAIVNNLFDEPCVGYVAHNRASLLLLEDEALTSWVTMFTTDLLLPIANTVPAMRKWPGSEESDQTAVNLSFNHTLRFFDHVQADEKRARRYDLSMRAHGSREGFDVLHTVQSYPWANLGDTTVVDLGGNNGFTAAALAEAYPSLSFIVQDLPRMRPFGAYGTMPKHLAQRVQLTTHDFFQPQPVATNAYFFRHVFHAFSDKYAIQILRALVPALRPGARIIINDSVLPAPGTVSRAEEKSLRTMDVLMQTVSNSREREIDDWKALFAQADPRFGWNNAWKSTGTLWFIEAIWEG